MLKKVFIRARRPRFLCGPILPLPWGRSTNHQPKSKSFKFPESANLRMFWSGNLCFDNDVVAVSLHLQGSSLKLIYCSNKKTELRRAEEELRDSLKCQTIPVENGFDEIMGEGEWQTLKKKVESSGKVYILEDVSWKRKIINCVLQKKLSLSQNWTCFSRGVNVKI